MEVLFSTPTCIAETTLIGMDKLLLSAVFFTFAFVTFIVLRRNISTKSKVALIYMHLAFLFFPFVLLTTNTACGALCMQCHNNYPALISYALPGTIAATTVAGLVFIPAFYTMSGRRELKNRFVRNLVKTYSRKLNIKEPCVYAINKSKPLAFSFRSIRSGIFLSIGMMDILNKKEIEAVVLHELAHIKQRASLLKFSSKLMKVFSPLSLVAKFHDVGKEEIEADRFAIKMQKTDRHVKSAKKKIEAFG